MRGSVIGFDPDTNTGAIDGEDGRRYDFVRIEWRGPRPPTRGVVVDFGTDGQNAVLISPASVLRGEAAEGSTAQIVYILYLVGLVVGVTGIVALIIAYVNRANAPEWVQTHYRFQIRSFWIGLLYGMISLVTLFILVGILFGLFTLVWWVVRCAKGLKLLGEGAPYDKPATWLW